MWKLVVNILIMDGQVPITCLSRIPDCMRIPIKTTTDFNFKTARHSNRKAATGSETNPARF
jgi:hypothetical protein